MEEKEDALSRFKEADRARGRAYRTRLMTNESGFQELFSLNQVQARARKLSLPFGMTVGSQPQEKAQDVVVEQPVETTVEETDIKAAASALESDSSTRVLESFKQKDQIVELMLEIDGLLREPVESLFNPSRSR